MNRLSLIIRRRILIIVFIILVIFGGLIIFWYIGNLKEKQSANFDGVKIFTAKNEIKSGTKITNELIEEKKIPENIFNEKFLVNKKDIIGKNAVTDIYKGEIISSDNIESSQKQNTTYLKFSSYIPNYLRAVSIPINFYGDSSILNVGDSVDIILTYYDKSLDEIVSETVLQKKEIILIKGGSSNNSEEDGKDSGEISFFENISESGFSSGSNLNLLIVTFYLSPEEVEKVFLSLQKGVLNLSICPKTNIENV